MLACTKVAIQGKLTRNNKAGIAGLCRINAAVFACTFLVMSILFFRAVPPREVLIAALLYGILSTSFQTFYMLAFNSGSIGATAAINNFGVIFTILAGLLVYNEPVNLFKIAGIILMAVPFILLPKRGGGSGGIKWLLFSVIAFISSGSCSLIMLVIAKNGFSVADSRMVVVFGYLVASIISSVIMNFLPGHDIKSGVFSDKLIIPKLLGVALPLGLYNVLLSTGLHYLPGSVLVPVTSVLGMCAILLLDIVFFKQKLTVRQYIGLGFAVVCVLLLNIG